MNMDIKTFHIYCLRKNGDLVEQATVNETNDSFNIQQNPLPESIKHMDSYLKELFNLMITYEKKHPYNHGIDNMIYKTKRYEYLNDEFIEATIFHRVLMRKGSYFYVYQQSDRGTRFLLYAIDRVHHSSNAFGSEMRAPSNNEQLVEMQSVLRNSKLDILPVLIDTPLSFFL